MAQTILLVDDDPVVHWVLGQYLQRAGYQTVSAKTGREGLERATHDLPQLIILDVRMKEIDGVAVLKELKETPATKEIPVIMMTVRADRATRLNSQLLGADLFLTKPFSPKKVVAKIQELIGAADKAPSQQKAQESL